MRALSTFNADCGHPWNLLAWVEPPDPCDTKPFQVTAERGALTSKWGGHCACATTTTHLGLVSRLPTHFYRVIACPGAGEVTIQRYSCQYLAYAVEGPQAVSSLDRVQ